RQHPISRRSVTGIFAPQQASGDHASPSAVSAVANPTHTQIYTMATASSSGTPRSRRHRTRRSAIHGARVSPDGMRVHVLREDVSQNQTPTLAAMTIGPNGAS